MRYSEQMQSRVVKERIIPYKSFFKALFDLQPNLSFTKEGMEAAVMKARHNVGWCRKNPNNLEEYGVRLAAKLRVMARHEISILGGRSSIFSIFGPVRPWKSGTSRQISPPNLRQRCRVKILRVLKSEFRVFRLTRSEQSTAWRRDLQKPCICSCFL